MVGYLDFSGTPWYYIGVPECDFLIFRSLIDPHLIP